MTTIPEMASLVREEEMESLGRAEIKEEEKLVKFLAGTCNAILRNPKIPRARAIVVSRYGHLFDHLNKKLETKKRRASKKAAKLSQSVKS